MSAGHITATTNSAVIGRKIAFSPSGAAEKQQPNNNQKAMTANQKVAWQLHHCVLLF